MRFTVLTPTYNRAGYLVQLYETLCAQTFHDFEWVIVDDGSTDGTEELISSWRPFFPIRYTWKPNGGKHTAVNVGVAMAAGDFVLITDSDNRCLPQTLERFDCHWRQIPDPDRFAMLVGLNYREDGKTILGDPFPAETIDIFRLRDALVMTKSDRVGVVRTDVLRRYPYPVFKGERFMLEGVVWNRILKSYGVRYFNEPVMVGVYAPGGLSDTGDHRPNNPKGAALYHAEMVTADLPWLLRAKAAINAVRFTGHVIYRRLRGACRARRSEY